MIVRAKCQECEVIYIKSKTSHPEFCGNHTYLDPIKVNSPAYYNQVGDENVTVKERDFSKPVIKSGNRYMSKVDWDSKKVRDKIKREIANDRTLSYIARCLKVSRSTLSKANKKYNLYPTHLYRINSVESSP